MVSLPNQPFGKLPAFGGAGRVTAVAPCIWRDMQSDNKKSPQEIADFVQKQGSWFTACQYFNAG
jgi:hypothetical protein